MTEKNTEKNKEQIMRQISKVLKDRRKAQNVDHKKVSQVLKIRVPFLDAMENARWDELPGEVYLRGFLLKYAQYLGINGKELIQPYIEMLDRQEEPDQKIEDASVPVENSRLGWVWAGVIFLLFIGLIKFLTPDKKDPVKSQDQFAAPAVVFTSPAPLPRIPPKPIEHEIQIFTPESLWVNIQSENKTFEGFIPEGATWSWRGDGEFNIRLGHTRQVVLRFDNEPVLLAENQKRVKLPYEN